jgi:hypothetical protein
MESMDVTPFGAGQLAAQWKRRRRRPDELAARGNNLKGKKMICAPTSIYLYNS